MDQSTKSKHFGPPSLLGAALLGLALLASSCQQPSDQVAEAVDDPPPEEEMPAVTLAHPQVGESAVAGQPFGFLAAVDDGQDDPEELEVTFLSDIEGILYRGFASPEGVAAVDIGLSEGSHQIMVQVEDTDDHIAVASVPFLVVGE